MRNNIKQNTKALQTDKMAAENTKIVLKIKFHVNGTTLADTVQIMMKRILSTTIIRSEHEVDKDFVRRYINEDDELDDYKLQEYSEYGVKKWRQWLL